MTRLLVLSDLHFEQRPAWSLPEMLPSFDVAIFAGDVDSSPEASIRRLTEAPGLAGKPVVYVPGNHEFYHGVLEHRLRAGHNACRGTSVCMLDRRTIVLAGVRFIGAVLWTDYRLTGDPITAQVACLRGMNDHYLIETTAAGGTRRFLPDHAMALHERDLAFIEAELTRPFAGKTVVVTHHAPHRGSVQAKYANDPVCAGFVSDLKALIDRARPDMWIHGHVHDSFDYQSGTTRVLCNPKGYGPTAKMPALQNMAFDDSLVVEV